MIYWYIDVYGKRKRHEKRGKETEEGETQEVKKPRTQKCPRLFFLLISSMMRLEREV